MDISFNKIKILPDEWMARQKELEELNASFNIFSEWPLVSSYNINIKKLDLQANKIHTIPNDVNLLDSLKEVSLKENKIIHLPESFWNISALSRADLSFNYIKDVRPPSKVSTSLYSIDLRSNEIKFVSKELFMIPSLRYLNLADNHITKLPFDTIPKEFDSIVLYGNPISEKEKARIMKYNPEAYFIMW